MIPAIVITLIVMFFFLVLRLIYVGFRLIHMSEQQRFQVARAMGVTEISDKTIKSLGWVYELKSYESLDDMELVRDLKKLKLLTRMWVVVGLTLFVLLLYLKHWH